MKAAIMQPYFFPYLGYWQLMNAVDKYVIYDDGLFRPRGWINRNRIILDNKPYYITIPVHRSPNVRIRDMVISSDDSFKRKMVKTLMCAYGKAPYFEECFDAISKAILNKAKVLTDYNYICIEAIRNYLNITTPLILSSNIEKDLEAEAKKKIIAICNSLGADEYINAIGGMELYNKRDFCDFGIKLSFLKSDSILYKQFNDRFLPDMSIIDVIMFNNKERVKDMLYEYSLI